MALRHSSSRVMAAVLPLAHRSPPLAPSLVAFRAFGAPAVRDSHDDEREAGHAAPQQAHRPSQQQLATPLSTPLGTTHAAGQPHVAAAAGSLAGRSEPLFGEGGYVRPHKGLQDVKEFGHSGPSYPSKEYLESVRPIFSPPQSLNERAALMLCSSIRRTFDWATNYGHGKMDETKWLQRILFLETIAGVPGMVGGMLRHLRSLRSMEKDRGWISTLLEEAENERMHLMTFMSLKQPGPVFRALVLLAQGVMFNALFVAYLLSPRAVHSFVGYIEEEAVKTYTHVLECMDTQGLWKHTKPPQIAVDYWKLGPDATMRDLVLAVRADEACHMHVNHTLSKLKPNEPNPFAQGKSQMP